MRSSTWHWVAPISHHSSRTSHRRSSRSAFCGAYLTTWRAGVPRWGFLYCNSAGSSWPTPHTVNWSPRWRRASRSGPSKRTSRQSHFQGGRAPPSTSKWSASPDLLLLHTHGFSRGTETRLLRDSGRAYHGPLPNWNGIKAGRSTDRRFSFSDVTELSLAVPSRRATAFRRSTSTGVHLYDTRATYCRSNSDFNRTDLHETSRYSQDSGRIVSRHANISSPSRGREW